MKKLSIIGRHLLLWPLVILALVPFLWLALVSFSGGDIFSIHGWRDLWPTEFTGRYYARLWEMREQLPMGRFFLNTLAMCVVGVVGEVILASLAAYPLARYDFKGKNLVFALMLGSMLLPSQANMIVNFVTIRAMGLYDTLLAAVLPACVSVFGVFLMRQAFINVPHELEDAARLDGCSELGVFWKVILPLTRPAQATLALFAFVAHWNSFMWPLVVLKSTELYPLSVGISYLSQTFDSDFRVVAAGSCLATLPIFIVFLLVQKQFISGLTAGAVK